MRSSIVSVSLALIAALPGVTFGAKMKVPQHFASIQDAIDAAAPGDTVLLAEGTYPGFELVGRTGIAVRAQGKVIIDADGSDVGVYLSGSSEIVLKNLRVRNADEHAVLAEDSWEFRIEGCRIEDSNNGILLSDSVVVDVVDNVIESVLGVGLQFNGFGNVVRGNRLKGCSIHVLGFKNTVEGNVIKVPKKDGIRVGDGGGTTTYSNLIVGNRVTKSLQDGIGIQGAEGCVLLDNVIEKSGLAGIHLGLTDVAHVIEGNEITKSGTNGLAIASDANYVTRNQVTKSGANGIWIGAGAAEGVYVDNLVKKSGEAGFFIIGGFGSFVANKAKTSGDVDLHDTSVLSTNAYVANDFETQLFGE